MRVVIYCRKSLDRQKNTRQIRELRELCEEKGWYIVKEFKDSISGYSNKEERHMVYGLVDFCVENKVDKVVLTEVSRLSRNMEVLHSVLGRLTKKHISVYFNQFKMETLNDDLSTNPLSNLIIGIIGSISNLEKEITMDRLKSGRQNYIKSGGRVGRPSGTITPNKQLLVKHNDCVSLLKKNYTIKDISNLTGKSPTTIQKVKHILKDEKLVL